MHTEVAVQEVDEIVAAGHKRTGIVVVDVHFEREELL